MRHKLFIISIIAVIVISSCIGFGITYSFFANKISASSKATIGVLKLDAMNKADGTEFAFGDVTVFPNGYIFNDKLTLKVNSTIPYYTRVLVTSIISVNESKSHINGTDCRDYKEDDDDVIEIDLGSEFTKFDEKSVNFESVFYTLTPTIPDSTEREINLSIKLADYVGEDRCQYYMNALVSLGVRVEVIQANYLENSTSGGEFNDVAEINTKWESIYPEKQKSFSDASWSLINKISESGKAKDYFKVGDEKTFQMSNGENVTMVILGFDHDDLSFSENKKAGITLGMKNLLKDTYQINGTNTNIGGWDKCDMRTKTMQALFTQLPKELQNVIKTVNKNATIGNMSTDIMTSKDKLWLLSISEIWPEEGIKNSSASDISTHADALKNEGTQYEYFKTKINNTGTSLSNNELTRKPDNNGQAAGYAWSLRTPCFDKNTHFYTIRGGGDCGPDNAYTLLYICFNFCI